MHRHLTHNNTLKSRFRNIFNTCLCGLSSAVFASSVALFAPSAAVAAPERIDSDNDGKIDSVKNLLIGEVCVDVDLSEGNGWVDFRSYEFFSGIVDSRQAADALAQTLPPLGSTGLYRVYVPRSRWGFTLRGGNEVFGWGEVINVQPFYSISAGEGEKPANRVQLRRRVQNRTTRLGGLEKRWGIFNYWEFVLGESVLVEFGMGGERFRFARFSLADGSCSPTN